MAATATQHDDHHHEVAVPDAKVDVSKVRMISLAALGVGAAVFLIGGFVGLGADPNRGVRDFFTAYLCGFVFWCSLPFGSLLLSFIGYLAQGGNFAPGLTYIATVAVIGALAYILMIGKVERVED